MKVVFSLKKKVPTAPAATSALLISSLNQLQEKHSTEVSVERTGKSRGRHPACDQWTGRLLMWIAAYKGQSDVAFDLATRINSRHRSSLAGLDFLFCGMGECASGGEDREN